MPFLVAYSRCFWQSLTPRTLSPTSHSQQFALNAFNNSGLTSPNHFGPYSPSAFDGTQGGANGASRSRPNSGYFEAFGGGAGFGLGSTTDPSGLSEPTTPAGIKSASLRKGELDVATRLEELQGEIFPLCKDQHGCRYLQKKLEENTPHYRDMIFAETFDHFSELMTGECLEEVVSRIHDLELYAHFSPLLFLNSFRSFR